MKILTRATILISLIIFCLPVMSESTLKILSTTSTRDSGFYNYILPIFEKKFDIKTYTINTGTGQAIMNGKNCNGDILITHSKYLEDNFVKNGYGLSRKNLMHNRYVLIGPAKYKELFENTSSVIDAYNIIYSNKIKFVSRGDESGTHLSEKKIWNNANLNLNSENLWYLSVGQGMGPTLNMAIAMNSVTYSDIATWLKFANKGDHVILFEGDDMMINQYGITLINPNHCKNINHDDAKIFHKWMLSDEGQGIIGQYKYNNIPLFRPNLFKYEIGK